MTKIMLVEDDKSLREIYSIRLVAEGYNVVSAGDGEEALAMAVRERPELIISDVMMPKISGFDMLDIIRSTPETKDIKVIMMTALSSDDQRKRGENLGADRYLVKSQVGIEDVVNAVHEVLGDRPNASAIGSINALASVTPPVQTAAPAPAPQPVAMPAQPMAAPQPTPAPTPVPVAVQPAPTPVEPQVAAPQPTPAPQPQPQPAPIPAPAPAPQPEPIAPQPTAIQTPEQPAPVPQPAPQPMLAPQPAPIPQPQPQPAPAPAPAPVQIPVSAPAPQPTPAPAPQPQPAPAPQPEPVAPPQEPSNDDQPAGIKPVAGERVIQPIQPSPEAANAQTSSMAERMAQELGEVPNAPAAQ